jgi:hypothetical protein
VLGKVGRPKKGKEKVTNGHLKANQLGPKTIERRCSVCLKLHQACHHVGAEE